PGWTRRARSLRLPARRPVAHGAIAPRASCRERGLSLGPVTGAEPPAENGAKLFETRFCRPYTVLGGEPERPRARRVAWSNARHPRSEPAPHRVPHGGARNCRGSHPVRATEVRSRRGPVRRAG